jgi:diacylglycerol kinase family enzyme
VANIIAKYQTGAHFAGEEIEESVRDIFTFVRGKKVALIPEKPIVANIDGECNIRKSMHIEVMPACARFVLPAKLYAVKDSLRALQPVQD